MSKRRLTHLVAILALLAPLAPSQASTRARAAAETVIADSPVRLAVGGGFVDKFSPSSAHACQVVEDGTVRCWGSNESGQLGDGTTTDRVAPVTIGGLTNAVAVAAGRAHTCALLAEGSARCWGENTVGQLGDGTLVDRLFPVPVGGLTTAVAIVAGDWHTCALLGDGSARCWGENVLGQLGNGTTTDQLTPVAVSGLTTAVALAAGSLHTCAVLANGTARCWGNNLDGQLGNNTFSNRSTPVTVSLGLDALENVAAIAAGASHTCALIQNGTVFCWGSDFRGQLGDGIACEPCADPDGTTVVGLDDAVAVAAGNSQTCALLGDGSARCWGRNSDGQLGDGTTTNRAGPISVNGLGDVVAIESGDVQTCALLADGTARCWGSTSGLTPTTVVSGGAIITGRDVAAGSSHTCAVRANTTVSCWGDNGSGQLGDGTITTRLAPVAVSGLGRAVAVAAGDAHTCALLVDGTGRCWGDNSSGQLGDGTTTARRTAVGVSGLGQSGDPRTSAVAIATGGAHTCAVVATSDVKCWGDNNQGQLGDGTTSDRRTPVSANGLGSVSSFGAGAAHTCAVRGVRIVDVRCWGDNSLGQLGDGTTTDRRLPTPIGGLNEPVAIAAGNNHTCALQADGRVRCWGANTNGQLGDGATVPRSFPVTVVGLTAAVAIAAGASHTCAALADGTARCWGDNSRGQLGDGTTTQRLTPTTVTVRLTRRTFTGDITFVDVPLANITQIVAGRRHSCAIIANGSLRCWGENSFGQLGNDSTIDQPRPFPVSSFTFNIDPRVGLHANGRVATVDVLATCEPGRRLHAQVTLTQGDVSGHGVASGECTGGIERYPATVPAHGPAPFGDGPAQAEAEAVIRERGDVVDTQEWTRNVQIVTAS